MRNIKKKSREDKMQFRKRAALFVMMAALLITVFPVNAQAASAKWKKACKAYNSWLAKNSSKFKAREFDFSTKNTESYKKADRFMLVDLDKNGVPELIVTHPIAWKDDVIYVYTYKSGKVVQVKDMDGRVGELAAVSISCQASGRYEVYKCEKKHLHVIWNGGNDGTDETVYTVSKGKLKQYARANEVDIFGNHNSEMYSYTLNGKKVTAKKYKAFVKKCGKDRNYFVSNTKANRKKYLK